MAEPTTYIVLRRSNEDEGAWLEVLDGAVSSHSAVEAVRCAAMSNSPSDGTYVAVPARSWKPVSVKAETQTVLRIEEAT